MNLRVTYLLVAVSLVACGEEPSGAGLGDEVVDLKVKDSWLEVAGISDAAEVVFVDSWDGKPDEAEVLPPPFVPPTPVFGYYDEGVWEDWEWMDAQLEVLAEYDLALFLGMMDSEVGNPDLLDFLRKADELGVEVRAWVLLPYEQGYWPGETNATEFAAAALKYAAWFLAEGLGVRWIVVDMETDIDTTMKINGLFKEGKQLEVMDLLVANLEPEKFAAASAIYQQMVDELEGLGFYSMVVTYPQVLDDLPDGDTSLQDMFDIPVSTVSWHEVSPMVYTTTFEEMSGGTFGPYVVYDYALRTVDAFGDAASIALGVSGAMEDPGRLAAEIAAAKAGGIERIQVYSYRGSLDHTGPAAWHQAFQAPAEVPPEENTTSLMSQFFEVLDMTY